MQEHRWDETDEITPNVTAKQLSDALKNELNKAVTLHKAGSVITRSDGSRYVVHTDGSLRKMKVEIEESELKELREAAKKLNALEGAGVDNWEGYDDAMQILREKEAS